MGRPCFCKCGVLCCTYDEENNGDDRQNVGAAITHRGGVLTSTDSARCGSRKGLHINHVTILSGHRMQPQHEFLLTEYVINAVLPNGEGPRSDKRNEENRRESVY